MSIAIARRGTMAGKGSFAPTALSGLELWLDADSVGVANGASVTTWSDSSGQANHATGGVSPTYATNVLNGHAVVRFSGTQWLQLAATIGGPTRTFFAVAKNTDNSNGSVILGGTGSYSYLFLSNFVRVALEGGATVDSATFATGAFRVCEHWGKNGSNQHRTAYDGNYGSIGTSADVASPTRVGYYGGGAAFYMEGDIAEIISYSRILTSGELSQVRAYLATKYALTVAP